MFTTKMNLMTKAISFFALAVSLVAIVAPSFANAATYAYVDATGEVKSIVANDWKTAINTAPNIHVHSGVLLLNAASDFKIIGDDVKAF